MLFINPHGILCYTVALFGRELFTAINVTPRFDGYDVVGNIINENDFLWESIPAEIHYNLA